MFNKLIRFDSAVAQEPLAGGEFEFKEGILRGRTFQVSNGKLVMSSDSVRSFQDFTQLTTLEALNFILNTILSDELVHSQSHLTLNDRFQVTSINIDL